MTKTTEVGAIPERNRQRIRYNYKRKAGKTSTPENPIQTLLEEGGEK